MFHPLEHELLKILKEYPSRNDIFLVAVSGGADSMALLQLLYRTEKMHGAKIIVLHCFHGEHENGEFRKAAQDLVQKYCEDKKLSFYICENESTELFSENDYRGFRLQSYRECHTMIQEEYPNRKIWVLTAHHHQDLVETRLMRLIRGVGHKGLKGIAVRSTRDELSFFRPLLGFSPNDLKDYLKEQNQAWLDDPTNNDTTKLRNFIRHEWLEKLEGQFPGSTKTMSRSFENILTASHVRRSRVDQLKDECLKLGYLSQNNFFLLSQDERILVLQEYVQTLGVAQFRRSQIEEVLKQIESQTGITRRNKSIPGLDKLEKAHTFSVGGLVWEVNAQQITASPALR